MIWYNGGPIWGLKGEVARLVWQDTGAFVCYLRPDQLKLALDVSPSVVLDNGAFPAWKRGFKIDWAKFWPFVEKYADRLDWWVIPDVVDGGEADNDRLIEQVPEHIRATGAPVWHLHESLERLVKLCQEWPRVCLGSSGEYARPKAPAWHGRMCEAFDAIADSDGRLPCQVHGLRMLDKAILTEYPLSSADSTNLARNVPLDAAFPNGPACRLARAAKIKERIVQAVPPERWLGGLRIVQPWQNRPARPAKQVKSAPKPTPTAGQLGLFDG